jgi:DICT domain-containing protein
VLLAKSRRLEEQAAELGADAVLLSTFQDARFFEGATRERYARLAERAALVGALGTGISDDPAPRVRGAALADSDALRQEWTVIVLGPHFAAAFAARDLGDEGTPDESRRFEMALTYERDTVVAAARSLMGKLVPQVAPADEAAVWLGPLSGAASRA